MKVHIIGKGNVGSALADRAAAVGHTITISNSATESGQVATDIAAADLTVLAVPHAAIADFSAEIKEAFRGRTVVDATNPLTADFMGLTVGYTSSGGEQVAETLPGAHVVKAFSSVLAPQHASPEAAPGTKLFVPVASDDLTAKKQVLEFACSLGFDAVDAGVLANARFIEPATELLIHLAYGQGLGAGIGFALTRA
ncbi:NADPH-dependent F420 reductase [Streptomyces sp. NPDC053431]|uniref:NADPH-dependent F420 reductase n=1 Tax=Streptomyces sp. NPDC053431 TaxID=3365703 RepID=UPI0037D2C341